MMMMREAKQQDKLKRSFHAPRSPFLLLVLGISNSISRLFRRSQTGGIFQTVGQKLSMVCVGEWDSKAGNY